jgi:hypothetical protein
MINVLLVNARAEETMKVAEALEGTSSGGNSYRSSRVVPDVSADYDPSMEDMEDEMLRQALLLSLQDCTSPYEMYALPPLRSSSFFFVLRSFFFFFFTSMSSRRHSFFSWAGPAVPTKRRRTQQQRTRAPEHRRRELFRTGTWINGTFPEASLPFPFLFLFSFDRSCLRACYVRCCTGTCCSERSRKLYHPSTPRACLTSS